MMLIAGVVTLVVALTLAVSLPMLNRGGPETGSPVVTEADATPKATPKPVKKAPVPAAALPETPPAPEALEPPPAPPPPPEPEVVEPQIAPADVPAPPEPEPVQRIETVAPPPPQPVYQAPPPPPRLRDRILGRIPGAERLPGMGH